VPIPALDEDRRTAVGEVGSCSPEQEQRDGFRAVGDETDELEQRLLGPVQILEDDYERTARRSNSRSRRIPQCSSACVMSAAE
jgi:hypothetical protein